MGRSRDGELRKESVTPIRLLSYPLGNVLHLDPRKKSCTFTATGSEVGTSLAVRNTLLKSGSEEVVYSTSIMTVKVWKAGASV